MKENLKYFNTISLAKEKGFEPNTMTTIYTFKNYFEVKTYPFINDTCRALLLFEIQKWLIEIKEIWVTIKFGYKIEWEVRDCRPKSLPDLKGVFPWNIDPVEFDGLCDTYEEALNEGLLTGLNLIE